jgi:hypothetical protein
MASERSSLSMKDSTSDLISHVVDPVVQVNLEKSMLEY